MASANGFHVAFKTLPAHALSLIARVRLMREAARMPSKAASARIAGAP
jgi:hypothetical protein